MAWALCSNRKWLVNHTTFMALLRQWAFLFKFVIAVVHRVHTYVKLLETLSLSNIVKAKYQGRIFQVRMRLCVSCLLTKCKLLQLIIKLWWETKRTCHKPECLGSFYIPCHRIIVWLPMDFLLGEALSHCVQSTSKFFLIFCFEGL